jgi:DNA-binding response OmpR family regulator
LAANGQPVSREELYFAAWGEGECKGELVNLYLHYLRKKLEENGRRFIFAVRGRGYCLTQEEGRI